MEEEKKQKEEAERKKQNMVPLPPADQILKSSKHDEWKFFVIF